MKKKIKIIDIFFSFEFITGAIGSIIWMLMLTSTDFLRGLSIGIAGVLIGFFWSKYKLSLNPSKEQENDNR